MDVGTDGVGGGDNGVVAVLGGGAEAGVKAGAEGEEAEADGRRRQGATQRPAPGRQKGKRPRPDSEQGGVGEQEAGYQALGH